MILIRKIAWVLVGMGVMSGLWVLNASQAGQRTIGCLVGCVEARAEASEQLRVVSLNMLHGYPDFELLRERLWLIGEEIVRMEADVVLLQEVPWTRELGNGASYLAEGTGMNYVYLRANGNRGLIFFEEGEAILSRYPLKDIVFTELKPQEDFFEHRVALGATVVTPWGEVQVFVTHLTNGREAANREQVEALRAFVEANRRGTTIVAGDFNADEDSPQIASLSEAWVDAYRTVNPGEAGFTCCIETLTSGPGVRLSKRIDYAFLVPGGNVQVGAAGVTFAEPTRLESGWLRASDHAGLIIEIEFEDG